MGFIGSLVRGLRKAFRVSPPQQDARELEPTYSQQQPPPLPPRPRPPKPRHNHGSHAQGQSQGSYSVSSLSQPPPPPLPPRPCLHKTQQGHGPHAQGQSQGTSQGRSSVPSLPLPPPLPPRPYPHKPHQGPTLLISESRDSEWDFSTESKAWYALKQSHAQGQSQGPSRGPSSVPSLPQPPPQPPLPYQHKPHQGPTLLISESRDSEWDFSTESKAWHALKRSHAQGQSQGPSQGPSDSSVPSLPLPPPLPPRPCPHKPHHGHGSHAQGRSQGSSQGPSESSVPSLLPLPPRSCLHKPYNGHGSHAQGQSQGPSQGPSSVPSLLPLPPRPCLHKPYNGHGSHPQGQSQEPSQGPSSVPPLPLPPRSCPYKPHHSHEYHVQGQSEGPSQGPYTAPSPPPPASPQNQWTSPQPQPPQAVHPTSPRPPHGRVDQKVVNSQNEHYVSLRERANQEGDAMARAFDQSHEAYARKDGVAAKELSNEGKAHRREMERLNAEASAWIFRENNRDTKPGEVDLHGLYVKEAITYTDQSIVEAQARGDKEIRLIVGKGIHSTNHAAKLKPAIEELMQSCDLAAVIDPQNSGVLIVQLDDGTSAEQVRDQGSSCWRQTISYGGTTGRMETALSCSM